MAVKMEGEKYKSSHLVVVNTPCIRIFILYSDLHTHTHTEKN